MKKLYVTLFLLNIIFCASAQKEGNIWYFGYNAGLDFNGGAPVLLNNSAMQTYEGCSSICDSAGNLLFYTDGTNVWDNTHTAMPNGYALTGNTTSSQSAIIIKQPGHQNIYYIFTLFTDYSYSIVDMTLNGGKGDVTSTKNIVIQSGVNSEKQCATRHANGADIWLVMHSGTTFYSYTLTTSGFNTTPVITTTGLPDYNVLGPMRFSPGGDKVAYGIYAPLDPLTLCVLYFNKYTGIFSNSISLSNGGNQCYGIEFSPDGSKLYATDWLGSTINQYDLNAGSDSMIVNSKTSITPTGQLNQFASLQVGPDRKMYLTRPGMSYLSCIPNPDSSGVACGFVDSVVVFTNALCELSFPEFVSDYFTVPTGLIKTESNDALNIFPNPAQDHIFIQGVIKGVEMMTTILDISGRIVYENRSNNAVPSIYIGDFARGIYILDVAFGENHSLQKFVKE